MNEVQFIEEIKKIKIDEPDEYFFLEFNKVVFRIIKEKEQLQQEKDKYKYIVNRVKEFMEEHKDEEIYYYQDTPQCFQDLCIYDDLLKELEEKE